LVTPNLQFTGDDFFADKNVCSIVLELPNSALGANEVRLWARTLTPDDGGRWSQVERGLRKRSYLSKRKMPTSRVIPGREVDLPELRRRLDDLLQA
jgi:hypothetical protein